MSNKSDASGRANKGRGFVSENEAATPGPFSILRSENRPARPALEVARVRSERLDRPVWMGKEPAHCPISGLSRAVPAAEGELPFARPDSRSAPSSEMIMLKE